MEEEQQIFNRCSSRQIYISLCVNAVKRIRELPGVDHDTATVSVAKEQAAKPLQKSYAKIAADLIGSITPSKTIIRPSSVSLAKADKKHSSLLDSGQEGNRKSLITNVSDLTGSSMPLRRVQKKSRPHGCEPEEGCLNFCQF